jgi:hypothetical protein
MWTATGMWHMQPHPEAIAVTAALVSPLVALAGGGTLPAARQGAAAAWFGEAATGTYCGSDWATVAQTPGNACTSARVQRGTLTSPVFSLAGRKAAYARFSAWWEVESGRHQSADRMTVEASRDGGATWRVVRALGRDDSHGDDDEDDDARTARSSAGWRDYRVDLRFAAGSPSARVRFAFDSVDRRRNGYRGLLIDGAAIVDAAGTPLADDARSGFGDSAKPPVTLGNVVAVQNADGTWTVTFVLTLEFAVTEPVVVDYVLHDGSGAQIAAGTATFPPGTTSLPQTVTLPASAVPPLVVSLANAQGALLAGAVSASATAPDGAQLILGVRQQGIGLPVLGQSFVVSVVSGTVRYRLAAGQYLPLTQGSIRTLPFGSVIDADSGVARIVVQSDRQGTRQQGDFGEGRFGVFQNIGNRPTAEMRLAGGSFRSCARSGRARGSAKRSVRKLWGTSTGRFRTKARFAAATVRGTKWLTEDLCLATRVRVSEGVVTVRDFRRRRNTVVRAGESVTISALQSGRYRGRSGLRPPRISRD